MTSVRTHLWFGNDRASEAAHFYAENIPSSSVDREVTARNVDGGRICDIVEFTVNGHQMIGLNAGPEFKLNEAFSFYLSVEGQDEVDRYWEILTADGGEPGPCGWCKDKFGISWQVVPQELEDLCGDYETDAERRTGAALMGMGKVDIAQLQAAYDGS